MRNAVQSRKSRNRAKASGVGTGDAEGHVLVGFGPYSHMTRQALYQSMEQHHKNYVRDLLCHPVTHPGSQLDQLKRYLARKQEQEREDDETLVQIADEIEQRTSTGTYKMLLTIISIKY